jgi:dienelactone hydrolase
MTNGSMVQTFSSGPCSPVTKMPDKPNSLAIARDGVTTAPQPNKPPTEMLESPAGWSLNRSRRSANPLADTTGPIPFRIFRPAATTRGPAIFFLHGAYGLTPHCYPFINHLTNCGYHIFAPLYFTRTGTLCAGRKAVDKHFLAWIGALIDSMFDLRSRAEVDSSRIGVAGISLGASLSLALAAQCSGIRAVVDFSGEIPAMSLVSLMPPTLVVHGAADGLVPVAKIFKLVHALRQQNTPCLLKIYTGERHVLRPAAFDHAMSQASAFFDKYVK